MALLEYESTNQDNWMRVGDELKSGVLILTKIPTTVGDVAAVWFKFIRPDTGPIPANEYIASRLGQLLDLPVAKIQFKEFEGMKGSISYQVAPESYTWGQFPYKADMAAYLADYDLMAHIIVFDVFINNADRNQENLLYSKLSSRNHKYNLHLIDHGHSLLGPSPQYAQDVFNFGQHILLGELQALFKHGFSFFEEALGKVGRLPDEKIQAVVDEVPDEYLDGSSKQALTHMLLSRKEKIYNEFSKHCNNYGGTS